MVPAQYVQASKQMPWERLTEDRDPSCVNGRKVSQQLAGWRGCDVLNK